MKLIDTVRAGMMLNVNTHRVRTFIRKGYLNDYVPINPERKKHFPKLSLDEVRAFKQNYVITKREVFPRNGNIHMGREYTVDLPTTVKEAMKELSAVKDLPIPVPPKYLPINRETLTPVQSFNERLKAIEEKLDFLIGMWK